VTFFTTSYELDGRDVQVVLVLPLGHLVEASLSPSLALIVERILLPLVAVHLASHASLSLPPRVVVHVVPPALSTLLEALSTLLEALSTLLEALSTLLESLPALLKSLSSLLESLPLPSSPHNKKSMQRYI
jgi:hypothetical protein